MRIVIADDSEETRLGIERLIKAKFPQFVIEGVFADGATLMEYLDKNVPDLMITDIRMPGFSGLSACKKLREASDIANIILITAFQDFEYAKQGIRFHVHDLLVKPFTSRQLVESILSMMDSQGIDLADKTQSPDTRQQHIARKAKEYIAANYADTNLSVTKIAEQLQITPNYLSNIFSTENGMKLSAYINQVRIVQAKKLLISTEFSFQEIADSVGFTSVQYFYKLFKKETGMTPSEYVQRKLS